MTVDASLLNDLSKTADDLRVKDVFVFKPYTALGLELTRAGSTVSFEKSKPAGSRRRRGGRLEADETGSQGRQPDGHDGSPEHVIVASRRSIRPDSRGLR